MIRQRNRGHESDRYISARSSERKNSIDKYLITDLKSIGSSSHGKTLPSRTPDMISNGNQPSHKLYLSLLKNQIFNTRLRNKAITNENSATKASSGIKPCASLYNKAKNYNDPIVKNLNEMCFKSIAQQKSISGLFNVVNTFEGDSQETIYDPVHDTNIRRFNSLLNFNLENSESTLSILREKSRIPKTCYKIIDSPNLLDDFYLHLIDWSARDDLAVGLDKSLYILDKKTSQVHLVNSRETSQVHLVNSRETDCYTALAWMKDGTSLVLGTNDGKINVFDANEQVISGVFPSHSRRIDVITMMNCNNNVFTVGSQDRAIASYDVRCNFSRVITLMGHTQEVCGLRWSHDDFRLASGGNDNKVMIWSQRTASLEKRLGAHTSAVKAIDWSPHKLGFLITGGGTQDRKIRLWNINTMKLIDSIETCSQVCNVAFSKISNEFVSTHGYTDNYILVWDATTMDVKATLKGHRNRVLYMTLAPDSQSIATGAGDDSIRFWKVFSPKGSQSKELPSSLINNKWKAIR